MTVKKGISFLSIGAYAGALISCLTVLGMGYVAISDKMDRHIDNRIENKTKYIVILLKQIATEDQKRKADEEFTRWENSK